MMNRDLGAMLETSLINIVTYHIAVSIHLYGLSYVAWSRNTLHSENLMMVMHGKIEDGPYLEVVIPSVCDKCSRRKSCPRTISLIDHHLF